MNEKLKEALDKIDKIKNTDIEKVEVKNVLNSEIPNNNLYENENDEIAPIGYTKSST
jgi:hypothetical protein